MRLSALLHRSNYRKRNYNYHKHYPDNHIRTRHQLPLSLQTNSKVPELPIKRSADT